VVTSRTAIGASEATTSERGETRITRQVDPAPGFGGNGRRPQPEAGTPEPNWAEVPV
jgi:hypothetical protein